MQKEIMKKLMRKVPVVFVALLCTNIVFSRCCMLICEDIRNCENIKLFESQNLDKGAEPQEFNYTILEDSR